MAHCSHLSIARIFIFHAIIFDDKYEELCRRTDNTLQSQFCLRMRPVEETRIIRAKKKVDTIDLNFSA